MKKEQEKLFGTDGIRGTPGMYPLTNGMIFKIGVGVSKVITYKNEKSQALRIVIGRDTRLTGRHIEAILSNAANSYGIDIFLAGVITTPGLSFLVKKLNANMGIMISASHNKASDNGIKFFNSKGFKLSSGEEDWIESIIFSNLIHRSNGTGDGRKGGIYTLRRAQSKYIEFLISTVTGLNLEGMRIALDCGCGAASSFAAGLYKKLGARVLAINDEPSGENINTGGAVNPTYLQKLVLESDVDIGIALDGDADRCILIDKKGNVLDGDYILAIVGNFLLKRGELPQNTIVGTAMSNLGFKISIENNGGKVISTKVGDKYVLEALLKNNLSIGGEQSGHIIFLNHLSSPDGLLTSLQILKVMKETGISLSGLAECMDKFPQVLVNVEVREKKPFHEIPRLDIWLKGFNAQLKDEGRILLRYSGTEKLARVMVEGKEEQLINEIANSLANIIRKDVGVEAGERMLGR